jgi:hypothetical protein
MSLSIQHDIGAYIVGKNAFNPLIVTAGAGADGTEITGFDISMSTSFTNTGRSVKAIIAYSLALATGKTATLTGHLQQGATTASFADTPGSTFSEVLTTASDANGEISVDVTLKGDWDFVRLQVTPTLSAVSVDTADMGGVLIFGGYDVRPAA